jgi:hypothetical protein
VAPSLNQWFAPESGFKLSMSIEHPTIFQVLMPADSEALQYANVSCAHEYCLVIQLKPIKTICQCQIKINYLKFSLGVNFLEENSL